MRKGVVFGAGGTGRHVYEMNKDTTEILCFVDNDETKTGSGGGIDGKEICRPGILKELDFDVVFLGTLMGLDEVPKQLKALGVPVEKLDKTYVEISVWARILFLQRFSERVYKEGIEGTVAEAGVYRGEFAKHINRLFPDRRCYLFDTFEGFTDYDISKEQEQSLVDANHLKNVKAEDTLAKMSNLDMVEVRIGRFPETAAGLEEKFAFVNLDMDLYEPTLEGLWLFYPRMSEGGIILVHDYFNKAYPNIEKAISNYEKEQGERLHKMPIGDDITMAIVK